MLSIRGEGAEVAAALKKMKRHTAPGLSGLVAEMIQATGDIGTRTHAHTHARMHARTHTHTHTHCTHNHFTAILDFVQDCPGELAP